MLVVLVVLLLLFGAEKMPGMARSIGRSLSQFRRAAREMSDELMHADLNASDPGPEPEKKQPAETVASTDSTDAESSHEGS